MALYNIGKILVHSTLDLHDSVTANKRLEEKECPRDSRARLIIRLSCDSVGDAGRAYYTYHTVNVACLYVVISNQTRVELWRRRRGRRRHPSMVGGWGANHIATLFSERGGDRV